MVERLEVSGWWEGIGGGNDLRGSLVAKEVLDSGSCPIFMTGEVIWMHPLLLQLQQEAEVALGVGVNG